MLQTLENLMNETYMKICYEILMEKNFEQWMLNTVRLITHLLRHVTPLQREAEGDS